MKYFTSTLLVLGLVLTGAGCSLQQPQPIDPGQDNEAIELREENERLKRENRNLKDDATEAKPKDNEAMKDEEIEDKDEMKEKDTMEEDDEEQVGSNKVLNEVTMEVDENSVIIFLTALREDYDGGDAFMEIGCEDVLVPVKVELEKDMSDLAHAVVQLLVTKRAQYEDRGLSNSVAGIGLTLANVLYEDGLRIIEFEGEPQLSGVCEDARIQAQVEQTIELYTDNYEIRLNGSADNWVNLFNLRG